MSDSLQTVEWYVYEPPAPKVPKATINVKAKQISVNTQAYQLMLTTHCQIGVFNGQLVIKPIDLPEGSATNPNIIPIIVRTNGQVTIGVPKHFRQWLDNHKIDGKYVVAYNDQQKWVETKEKVE